MVTLGIIVMGLFALGLCIATLRHDKEQQEYLEECQEALSPSKCYYCGAETLHDRHAEYQVCQSCKEEHDYEEVGICQACLANGGEMCGSCLLEMEDAFGTCPRCIGDELCPQCLAEAEQEEEHYAQACYVCLDGSDPHIVCDDCYKTHKKDLKMYPRCSGNGYSYMYSFIGVWRGPFDAMGPCIICLKRDTAEREAILNK